MNTWHKNRLDYKEQVLDPISPSFCAAKWTQVTLHLGFGHNHSCHHPNTHLIPVDEIAKDPGAIHNTSYKKAQRKLMLEGSRPAECDYCWKVEDSGHVISDRIIKSYNNWSSDRLQEVLEAGSTGTITPSYLEVSFSNVCNLKCSYCAPHISSKWMEEIKEYGPYPTSMKFNNLEHIQMSNKIPILEREYNPYFDAFWKWWPEVYEKLHTFRITGGEPLLTKHTFKVLDYIIEHPNNNLELSINTNLCIPDNLLHKFIEKLKIIQSKNAVKEFTLFTSCEAHGKSAEYIRFGLDYQQWIKNCEIFMESIENPKIVVMATYNLLSVTTFQKFLEDILSLNKKFSTSKNHGHPVGVSIPFLNNPPHQVVGILTPDFISCVQSQIEYMKANEIKKGQSGFYQSEIQQLERVLAVFESAVNNNSLDKIRNRKDFVLFVDEHDRRRNTNFLETFPELSEFYFMCKDL